MEEDLKELYLYDDLAVQKKIELILENNNIQFMVQSFEDTAYNGLFTLSKGKGKIFVFEKEYEKATKLLREEKILC